MELPVTKTASSDRQREVLEYSRREAGLPTRGGRSRMHLTRGTHARMGIRSGALIALTIGDADAEETMRRV